MIFELILQYFITKVLADVSYSLKKLREPQVSWFVVVYHEYRKIWKAEGNILKVHLWKSITRYFRKLLLGIFANYLLLSGIQKQKLQS